jgi:hypothetical protein
MTDFLGRLLDRQAGAPPAVARRRPSLFEGTDAIPPLRGLRTGPTSPRALRAEEDEPRERHVEVVADREPAPAPRVATTTPPTRQLPAGGPLPATPMPAPGAAAPRSDDAPPIEVSPQRRGRPAADPRPTRRAAPAATIAERAPEPVPSVRRVEQASAEPIVPPASIAPGNLAPAATQPSRRDGKEPAGLPHIRDPFQPVTRRKDPAASEPVRLRRTGSSEGNGHAPARLPPPAIHVTIGRIEVRSAPPRPGPSPLPAPKPRAPKLGLDDYLRARDGKAV